jgi:DNA polymerase-1
MSDKKTLLLVDGSSYLYRAFFAGGEAMSTTLPDGTVQKTGAIRIMINMMQKLRKEVIPTYAACVFDAKGPTFRDALYPEYKAQRSPMPDDLRSQIAPIHEVVRLLGWPVLDVPGVEADDVIGTLAVTAARQGIEVIISSGDKDLAQLVNEHITIIDTMSGKRRDLAGVEAEFGVPARLMLDYQTLVGRHRGQRARRAQGGPQDRREVAAGIRLAGRRGGAGRRGQGRGGREPAQGAGLAAHQPPTAHHQDRLRSRTAGCPACPRWTPSALGRPTRRLMAFCDTYGFKGLARDAGRARPRPPRPRPSWPCPARAATCLPTIPPAPWPRPRSTARWCTTPSSTGPTSTTGCSA